MPGCSDASAALSMGVHFVSECLVYLFGVWCLIVVRQHGPFDESAEYGMALRPGLEIL